MAKHNELGAEGEKWAVDYFRSKGYEILEQNWRHAHYEIDLIAKKNNCLHIIEVKTRRSNKNGYPETEVTRKKFRHLLKAADEFLYQHPEFKQVQYDILAITAPEGYDLSFFLLEDVYYY